MGEKDKKLILWFEELRKEDIPLVGGKCANLGELTAAGAPTPKGFAVTAYAYKKFIEETNIKDKILKLLSDVDTSDLDKLTETSRKIRRLIESTEIPEEIQKAILHAYSELEKRTRKNVLTSVRSSATAEDLPGASFAGQQDTYLYVKKENLLDTLRKCWSSLFTPRAISYREEKGFPHDKVLISVGVQEMVAPNPQAQGVMFTIHPVTGDPSKILIDANYGLGEAVVSGTVTPDTFVVDKNTLKIVEKHIGRKSTKEIVDKKTGKIITVKIPEEAQKKQCITDEQVIELAKIAKKIEAHYGIPMDIEWAIDNETGKIYILQARPETVWSNKLDKGQVEAVTENAESIVDAEILARGLGVSPGIGVGAVNIILDVKEIGKMKEGDILVTKMTTPSWVPAMKKASAVVTEEGGYTCHAAIVSRELGVPCVVGTGDATKKLKEKEKVTVDGDRGLVYKGDVSKLIKQSEAKVETAALSISPPVTATRIYVNLSIPEKAEQVAKETMADGVGLLRAEHMMLSIGKHPRKLIEEGGAELMIEKFAEGIRKVAQAFYPRPVIYRALDFKPDEFLALEGGEEYELKAGHVGPNPMIGYRGQYRYVREPEVFRLELKAIKRVREEYNLKNVYLMLPFVRTIKIFKQVKRIIKEEGLDPEKDPDFKLWIMVEVPSAVFIIDKLCEEGIDGVSVGSNDLTMLLLGVDRNDASVQEIYDERNLAVLRAVAYLTKVCKKYGVTVSICGQAPSVYPEYAEFLVRQGVTSISVNPDAVLDVRRHVAQIEQKILLEKITGKSIFRIGDSSEKDFEFWKILEE
ncbi:MAG: phosphoenolpyruvate synthase [Candidatus Odinarchaeia archaeon]